MARPILKLEGFGVLAFEQGTAAPSIEILLPCAVDESLKADSQFESEAEMEVETPPRGKRGRPSIFSQEIDDRICELMASGKRLRQICELAEMPAKSTVIGWASENDHFSDQYRLAREALLDFWSDELREIADDESKHWFVDGKSGEMQGNSVAVQRSKLHARMWLLSKLAPKRFGNNPTPDDAASGEETIDTITRTIVDPPARSKEPYALVGAPTARLSAPDGKSRPIGLCADWLS